MIVPNVVPKIMIEAIPYLVDKRKEITSIQFIIRIKGHRLRFVPGIKVETKFWIDNNKWCRENKQYPEGYLNNIQIKKYKDIIEQVLEDYQRDLVIPTQKTFKQAVIDRIDDINLQEGGIVSGNKQKEIEEFENSQLLVPFVKSLINKKNRSKNTLKTYQTVLNKIVEFEQENKVKLKFEDINMNFYDSFKRFLLNGDYSKNYIGSSFKRIVVFMNEAKDAGVHNFERPRGFVAETEDSDKIYLTEEEIKTIYELEFTEDLVKKYLPDVKESSLLSKIKRLQIERDRFIMGYCTALRISDYSRIDSFNIEDNLISIWTKKKDKKVYIPVHHYLKSIINKYDGLSLPKISDQKHNENIKEICQIAGINMPIRTTITKGGKRKEEIKPKYKLVSSHTARRSGATNMYRNGIDLLYISRLLGHSKIEQTVKYLKLTTKELAISLKDNPYFSGKKEEESIN